LSKHESGCVIEENCHQNRPFVM